ncbi:hypothetical protein LZC95_35705 [Pendulispora brunnea]|uniref:Nudix hydrolase domain-containing protein n=1 Tax=Pendulispora brunnea TaxID=2905690 RepID=A0ABZ2JZ85_9BACT
MPEVPAEVVPVDASTLILLRDADNAVSCFFVQRNKNTKFMGGMVVFPGGKVDEADRDPAWTSLCTAPGRPEWQSLGVAACREALEEGAILPVAGGSLDHATLLDWRRRLNAESLRELVRAHGLRLDLAALRPISRWLTPKTQSKRFDTLFFVARMPPGQEGTHDEHETVASFWATPAEVLARFDAGTIELAPPTHRTLEILATKKSIDDVFALANEATLETICPELVRHIDPEGDTMALVLPGDPEHSVREARIAGLSRFVMRRGAWRPEPAPRLP